MTAHDRKEPTVELETLYREHGDVEPDPGLDRVIRARADEATRRSALRRAPWLGGLATASMAVVVIAVVLQQPEGPQTARQEIPRATEPSAGIDSELAPESASRPAPQPAPPARTSGKSEDAGLAGDAPTASADAPPATMLSERARFVDDRTSGATAGLREAQAPDADASSGEASADALIERIGEALAGGDLQKARRLAADYRRQFPERPLPQELARRLEDG